MYTIGDFANTVLSIATPDDIGEVMERELRRMISSVYDAIMTGHDLCLREEVLHLDRSTELGGAASDRYQELINFLNHGTPRLGKMRIEDRKLVGATA